MTSAMLGIEISKENPTLNDATNQGDGIAESI